MCAKGAHTPLETTIAVLSVFILDEGFIIFVNWVVSQVGVLRIRTWKVHILILLRCEPHQTFPINVNSEGIEAGNYDVNSEVEFVTIQQ